MRDLSNLFMHLLTIPMILLTGLMTYWMFYEGLYGYFGIDSLYLIFGFMMLTMFLVLLLFNYLLWSDGI